MEFRILGPIDVLEDRTAIDLAAGRQRALLAYLVLHANEVVAGDRLIDAVWGRGRDQRVGNLLHVYVSRLRKALGGDRIRTHGRGYVLHAAAYEVDATRFEALLADARRALEERRADEASATFADALALWRGPALADLDEPFADADRARLEELRLQAVEGRIEADLELGRHAQLVPELEALVAEHPVRERLRAQLMLALYRAGRQSDALDAYRDARRSLIETRGIEPGPQLKRLEKAILTHDPAMGVDAPAPAVRTRAALLPFPATRLIGRADLVERARSLLVDDGVRQLTITGTGGIGKTRLALEVAHTVAGAFPDGAVFVDLGAVTPDRLTASLAHALGLVVPAAAAPEDVLVEHLRGLRVLLVLDGFERLVTTAPVLARLRAAAPELTLLVTSRTLLRVTGEHELEVPPLPPDDACTLFAERARAIGVPPPAPDATMTIREICVRLDGLPLAIELAAARAKLLPPRALLERLTRRLDLLTGGSRDAPERQRTMRATVDWSFRLLDADEQLLFASLGVFVGGAPLDAIESVCGSLATLGALESLVDISLVRRVGEEPVRFAMLETLREYALEQLAAAGVEATVRARHAQWFRTLVADAAPQLRGPEQTPWLDRLELEHGNLRAAVAWSLEEDGAETALAIANGLSWFWYVRGHYREGIETLRAVIDAQPVQSALERAATLRRLGALALRVGGEAEAIRWLEESVAAARAAGDAEAAAKALLPLGHAFALTDDPQRALEAATEARRLMESVGNRRGTAIAVTNAASYALSAGDAAAARAYVAESIAVHREVGDRQALSLALSNEGLASLAAGDPDAARAPFAEALVLAGEAQFKEVATYVLEGCAAIALADARGEVAAAFAGAADELAEELALRYEPYERRLRERNRAAIAAAVDPERADAAATAGRRRVRADFERFAREAAGELAGGLGVSVSAVS